MFALAVVWTMSAGLTWLLSLIVSFAMEGRMVRGTWVTLGLAIMSVLGPVGTLLTVRYLAKLVVFTVKETRLGRQPDQAWRLRPARP